MRVAGFAFRALFFSAVFVCVVGLGFFAHQRALMNEARACLETGDVHGAFLRFDEAGDFGEARAEREALVAAHPSVLFRNLSKGDRVLFGRARDASGAVFPIAWTVLDCIDGDVLLLSDSCVDFRPFHAQPFAPIAWEGSSLRHWLNGEFLSAFSERERMLLLPSLRFGEEQEAEVTDFVFLLSALEYSIYFPSRARSYTLGRAFAGDVALPEGAEQSGDGVVRWWLRSPGVYAFTAQFVDFSGERHLSGANVDLMYGVRPAIWVRPAE